MGERGYPLLDLVDRGDFVGVAGTVMRTRKGELSVQARELTFLSRRCCRRRRSGTAWPTSRSRYRQRYVDLMANPEVRRTFVARSAMVAEIRRFLDAPRLRRGRDADDAADRRAARWRGPS